MGVERELGASAEAAEGMGGGKSDCPKFCCISFLAFAHWFAPFCLLPTH